MTLPLSNRGEIPALGPFYETLITGAEVEVEVKVKAGRGGGADSGAQVNNQEPSARDRRAAKRVETEGRAEDSVDSQSR